ncbi:MAG: ferrous iron transport protein A [Caldimicrobium sp.]
MTLKEAKCGDVVVIKDFNLRENPLLKKLIAMGLRKEETFEVLKKCGRNILISNGNGGLVLSKELAAMIEVEVIDKKKLCCRGGRW